MTPAEQFYYSIICEFYHGMHVISGQYVDEGAIKDSVPKGPTLIKEYQYMIA